MKSTLVIIFLFLSVISCSKPEAPAPVALQFLNALQKRDYGTAAQLGTPETIKLLKQFEKIEQLNGRKDIKATNTPITIVSEDIRGSKATVYFKEEGDPLEQKISLVRITENGKQVWRVDLKKEEFQLMQQPPEPEAPI